MSKRDKISLIILAVFILGMAYYFLLIDPMMTKYAKLKEEAGKQHATLIKERAMADKLKEWKSHYDDSLGDVAKMLRECNNSLIIDNVSQVMNAILTDAEKHKVTIHSLTPMESVINDDDGNQVKIQKFALQANGAYKNFYTFMGRLNGIELEELNVSYEKQKKSVRFLMTLRSIGKDELKGVDIPKFKEQISKRKPLDNLFAIKVKPVPEGKTAPFKKEKEIKKEEIVPKHVEARSLNTSGLILNGLAKVGNKNMAIIYNQEKNECVYLWEGDKINHLTIKQIKDFDVILSNESGLTGKLILPKEKVVTADKATAPSKSVNTHPGHLGLMLNNYHKGKIQGLLIKKTARDNNVIFVGDVILTINGIDTPNLNIAKEVMKTIKSGEMLAISLWRDERKINVACKVK